MPRAYLRTHPNDRGEEFRRDGHDGKARLAEKKKFGEPFIGL